MSIHAAGATLATQLAEFLKNAHHRQLRERHTLTYGVPHHKP